MMSYFSVFAIPNAGGGGEIDPGGGGGCDGGSSKQVERCEVMGPDGTVHEGSICLAGNGQCGGADGCVAVW